MIGHFYFTHPIGAADDPRMEAMEEKLHGKGSGAYWYIREKMSYFSNNRCRLKQLVRFATRYYNKQMIEWVVQESGLFGCDEEDYFFPLKLKCELEAEDKSDNPSQPAICPSENRETTSKTTGKNSRKTTKNTRNASVSGKKTAENNENRAKNSEKTTEIDKKSTENSLKSTENSQKTAENSPKKASESLQKTSQQAEMKQLTTTIAPSATQTRPLYIKKKKRKRKRKRMLL